MSFSIATVKTAYIVVFGVENSPTAKFSDMLTEIVKAKPKTHKRILRVSCEVAHANIEMPYTEIAKIVTEKLEAIKRENAEKKK
jgi:hypothetical protein